TGQDKRRRFQSPLQFQSLMGELFVAIREVLHVLNWDNQRILISSSAYAGGSAQRLSDVSENKCQGNDSDQAAPHEWHYKATCHRFPAVAFLRPASANSSQSVGP